MNFKYVNGIPKFCYVRIVYDDKEKGGNIVKSLYNWDDEGDYWAFPFDKIEHQRFLYTAITRASEKAVLIKNE